MKRFDFPAVAGIIRDGLREGNFKSRPEFVSSLFESYRFATDKDFDTSLSNKWMNGKAPISPDICAFYRDSQKNRHELTVTLEDAILPSLIDSAMTVEKVHRLLIMDADVSGEMKEKLCDSYPCKTLPEKAAFLTDTLLFAMENRLRKDGEAASPAVEDYIRDARLPEPCRHFCGRRRELDALHKEITEHGIVFVCGVPGIGKSELAKAYAKAYGKEYVNILYLPCSGDLKRDIAAIIAADDLPSDSEEDRFRKHDRFLRTLREDSLLIIDNFSAAARESRDPSPLLPYRCRILVTTRYYLPERNVFPLGEMENPEDLLQLASCFYSDTERKKGVVKAIIEEVHSHTLAVEMTAKLMENARMEPELTLFEIQRGGVAYSYNDKVTITKDGRSYNDSYYGHISGLFGLRNLTSEQRDIMSCMSLVPFDGIPLRLFAEWMDMEDTNALKEMVELGYIQTKTGNRIALHPMMWDVALADATPGVARCKVMLEGIRYRLNSCNFNEWETLLGVVCNTVEFADKDDGEFFLPFLWEVFLCMERHGYQRGMDTLLPSLEWLIEDETLQVSIDRDEIRRKIADYVANADHPIRDAQWTFFEVPRN